MKPASFSGAKRPKGSKPMSPGSVPSRYDRESLLARTRPYREWEGRRVVHGTVQELACM